MNPEQQFVTREEYAKLLANLASLASLAEVSANNDLRMVALLEKVTDRIEAIERGSDNENK